jgi:hypothetical protein
MTPVGPLGARHAWLSLTPEPERELPEAIATLRAGGPPPAELVERECARADRLVTHGSRRQWRAYLAEAVALARAAEGDAALAEARAAIDDILENHDNLALGLARRRRRGTTKRFNGGSA